MVSCDFIAHENGVAAQLGFEAEPARADIESVVAIAQARLTQAMDEALRFQKTARVWRSLEQ